MDERDNDDMLQALNHAEELKHEQELLRADPAYLEWLVKLEKEQERGLR